MGLAVTDMSKKCQLKVLPEAGESLSVVDNLINQSQEKMAWLHRMGTIAIADPSRVVRKLASVREAAFSDVAHVGPSEVTVDATRTPSIPAPLGLQAGEVVRVKSLEDIETTLDANGRCQGLAFMSHMADHCGGTYVVHKRVRRFFDERTRQMLKLRNVVVLKTVYCEPPRGDIHEYAGCDRTCFFFWKDAWLERVVNGG